MRCSLFANRYAAARFCLGSFQCQDGLTTLNHASAEALSIRQMDISDTLAHIHYVNTVELLCRFVIEHNHKSIYMHQFANRLMNRTINIFTFKARANFE